jgi:triacylglycerol lipase
MADAVILIPGFFGFGKFGSTPGRSIEYFAGARDVIESVAPALAGRVLVHEPQPTGSIDERVASLHEAVGSVLAGRPLPNNGAVQADRVHLVGHSAGGVDARLFANTGFTWLGGPHGAERTERAAAVAQVVTVSAPHRGTPIATNALLQRDALLFGVYLLSIVGMGRLKAPASALLALGALVGRAPTGDTAHAVLEVVAGLDADGAKAVGAFLQKVVEDRQLTDDLAVGPLTARTAGLRATEHPRVACYVSVAPPPSIGLDHPAARLLYRELYRATAKGADAAPLPGGPVIGPGAESGMGAPRPSDGVVPAVSQTLDGRAAGIVLADHLDVVGHYAGGPGVSIFKSDSDFDDARFRALWSDIAARLD